MKGNAPIDSWSLVHIGSGATLAFLDIKPLPALTLLAGFEVIEAGLRKTGPGPGIFEHESPQNIAFDMLAGVAGYYLVKTLL